MRFAKRIKCGYRDRTFAVFVANRVDKHENDGAPVSLTHQFDLRGTLGYTLGAVDFRRKCRVDGAVLGLVLSFAVWTVYCHLITLAHASFDGLLQWLPLEVLVTVAALVCWFRCAQPGSNWAGDGDAGRRIENAAESVFSRYPIVVLLLGVVWVGLLFAGMSYAVFWWGALIGLGVAWRMRCTTSVAGTATASFRTRNWGVVLLVAIAAVVVTLVVNRPDPDDAFYMSIPASLLRFPHAPVLLHDTMYRVADLPLLLPVYRVDSYEVLVGSLSWLTGIPHMEVAYLVLPPLFAVFAVLAWTRLLRRLVPERWVASLVILFLCVLALGEAHQSYGNFAFVRLFQGKAILATMMVPVIVSAALDFSRDAGVRNWLVLFAAQIAALGFTSSALFVAPVAAGVTLVSAWSPSMASTRRLAVGLLASAYVIAAAGMLAFATHGGHGFVSDAGMPPMLNLIEHTWGAWSTALLLVALLVAWAFAPTPIRGRYFTASALLFMLGVLNPYTSRFVADHFTGASTYWRLTWALPIPVFAAVTLSGIVSGLARVRPRIATGAGIVLLVCGAGWFGMSFGVLRAANFVRLGTPGLKVYQVEYPVAKQVVAQVPESGMVLAPELVATWLPTFVHHSRLLGVRTVYLAQTFPPQEAKRRLALMQYVAGGKRSAGSSLNFSAALVRYGLTCVVVLHSASWRPEIDGILRTRGWQRIDTGAYDVWVMRSR